MACAVPGLLRSRHSRTFASSDFAGFLANDAKWQQRRTALHFSIIAWPEDNMRVANLTQRLKRDANVQHIDVAERWQIGTVRGDCDQTSDSTIVFRPPIGTGARVPGN